MKRHGPWRTLGLDPTEDLAAIRRAYADKLRALDVDREIEAYARLRQARDHALMLARGLVSAETEAAPAAGGETLDDSGIPHGHQAGGEPPVDGEVLERAETPSPPAGSDADPGPVELSPPEVLLAILFPNGEPSEQPLESGEWELARPALEAILREAEESSIDQHGAIEGWLAHHLASAWPRSAWLLEPAAEAFGWLAESGQLSERPAIQFLNHRLRGMRFVAKVSQPGHPLHKVWSELSKPGPKGAFAFMRVGKDDVANLLAGIRERYPEVESHLDPQRVASWEGSLGVTPASAWTGSFPIFLVIAGLALVRLCSSAVSEREPPVAPPPIEVAWSAEQVDQLIVELFGERLDNDFLRNQAPDLWVNIDRASGIDGDRAGHVEDIARQLLIQLRGQTQLAARDAGFEELLAIKRLKLEMLRIAREQGGVDDCLDYETQGVFPSNVDVPEAVRAQERAVAAELLAADLLVPSETHFPQSARIPGTVIEQIMQSTGLSEDAVVRAAQGDGSDAALCNYRIGLLEAVLRRPADVSADLLRIM